MAAVGSTLPLQDYMRVGDLLEALRHDREVLDWCLMPPGTYEPASMWARPPVWVDSNGRFTVSLNASVVEMYMSRRLRMQGLPSYLIPAGATPGIRSDDMRAPEGLTQVTQTFDGLVERMQYALDRSGNAPIQMYDPTTRTAVPVTATILSERVGFMLPDNMPGRIGAAWFKHWLEQGLSTE